MGGGGGGGVGGGGSTGTLACFTSSQQSPENDSAQAFFHSFLSGVARAQSSL